MSNNPDTLSRILSLIDRDVTIIATNNENQLDPATAQTLCRYASTLSDIRNAKEKEGSKEKQKLDRLSTEELIALYEEEKNKKNKNA